MLRSANVVDAGGQGFCAILQGCNDFLLHGSIRELPEPVTADIPEVFQHDHMETDPTFRYCTECLLAGEGMNIAAVREQLAGMGDSIVIAGSARRLKRAPCQPQAARTTAPSMTLARTGPV